MGVFREGHPRVGFAAPTPGRMRCHFVIASFDLRAATPGALVLSILSSPSFPAVGAEEEVPFHLPPAYQVVGKRDLAIVFWVEEVATPEGNMHYTYPWDRGRWHIGSR